MLTAAICLLGIAPPLFVWWRAIFPRCPECGSRERRMPGWFCPSCLRRIP